MGFGAHGKFFPGSLTLSYDAYLTNGLGEGIVLNSEGRTRLANGKGKGQFDGDNNGSPAFSGRFAIGKYGLGELGVSYYGGIYNNYQVEGDIIAPKRRLHIIALDYSAELGNTQVKGEVVYANIDLQDDLKGRFGEEQWGGHIDFIVPIWRPRVLSYNSTLNAVLRLERVDYNMGTFSTTGGKIYDEVTAVVPGLSFRPTQDTVFKLNYVRQWYRDLVGNDAEKTGGLQFGFATYF